MIENELLSLREALDRLENEDIELSTTVTVPINIAITRVQDSQGNLTNKLSVLLNFMNAEGEYGPHHAFIEQDPPLKPIDLEGIVETFSLSPDDKIWEVQTDFD